jgi:hypothetical protein
MLLSFGIGVVLLVILLAGSAADAAPQCQGAFLPGSAAARPTPLRVGGIRPWQASGAIGFVAKKMKVNADGAPNAYQPDNKGLSFLCDGGVAIVRGKPLNPHVKGWQEACNAAWRAAHANPARFKRLHIFAMVKDKDGRPVLQREGDPFPGKAYIATTSYPLPDAPLNTQRSFVNSLEVPFVTLPPWFAKRFKIGFGDVAVLYRPKTKSFSYAVYAENGLQQQLNEISVRAHRDLGNDPVVLWHGTPRAKGEINDNVMVVLFPGQRTKPTVDTPRWVAEMKQKAATVFDNWGGLSRLTECAGAHR